MVAEPGSNTPEPDSANHFLFWSMATLDALQAQFTQLSAVNDQLQRGLTETQEAFLHAQNNFKDAVAKIERCENQIAISTTENANLQTRLATITSNPSTGNRDLISRITKTDLLKSKEILSFGPKDNFEIWSESFKNDLFAKLPDARQFLDHAESHPDLDKNAIDFHLKNPTGHFDPETMSLVDDKI